MYRKTGSIAWVSGRSTWKRDPENPSRLTAAHTKLYAAGAAIIGETGGHVRQHFGWGDAKENVPPLIAHLVKFLGLR